MSSRYTFAEYSTAWPVAFQCEARRLAALLGDWLLAVHHVGSTSVPGLAAKPIIDLLPVVSRIHSVDERTRQMEQAGYRAWGEYGLQGRRYFTRDHGEYRTHNLHIYEVGHPDVERHLAFCEYLKSHEAACREYEALKREVFDRHPEDIDAYNDGKNDWIKRIEPLALAWFRRQAR